MKHNNSKLLRALGYENIGFAYTVTLTWDLRGRSFLGLGSDYDLARDRVRVDPLMFTGNKVNHSWWEKVFDSM